MADLPKVTVDPVPMRAVLVDLLGEETVRDLAPDLLGAMAYSLAALRQAPVERRMAAMGMVPVGWYGPSDTGSVTYAEQLPANPVAGDEDPF